MNLKLTIDQYLAIERLRGSSIELKRDTTFVSIEVADTDGQQNALAPYARVTFHASWGGKGSFDIDREGNSAQVNWGESEISAEVAA